MYYIIDYPIDLNIDENDNSEFKAYPNPASNIITISISNEILNQENNTLEIYNTEGKLITSIKTNSINTQFDVSTFTNGTYFIKLDNSVTIEFIVQH